MAHATFMLDSCAMSPDLLHRFATVPIGAVAVGAGAVRPRRAFNAIAFKTETVPAFHRIIHAAFTNLLLIDAALRRQ